MIQGPASLPDLPVLQRARGEGRVTVASDGRRTRLQRLYQEGCANIRLPASDGAEAVLINTAGGLTGGDRLSWSAEVAEGAALTLTSQACEKVYRARDGVAEVAVRLEVREQGRLDWLPQETILFDGGAISRRLEADLAPGARLLATEAVVLGRSAMGETVRRGLLRDRWRIRQEGRLIFADDLRLEGAVADLAGRAPLLDGARAFASILVVDGEAGRLLAPLRALLGPGGGASAFDGKLFARVAAPDGLALRRVLLPALELLRDGRPLPRVWRT
ncbi:MAG: urease accessory protein UreD [Phenylobacterium sp.]|uniref:urease accessory protein UreD n=1 Tax=Phenylobacterium sp. TaxID=1871053 RepID=UPI001A3F1B2D|nr:urease accessory protein UreD [Phenylobacterium sp.]MBL8771250.1 urease accessory protein UreD [Phenylobacterium sp.]